MSIDELTGLLTALVWPLTTLLLVAVFHRRLAALLDRLAATLTMKTLKARILGIEVELSPEHARSTLDELLADIAESTAALSAEERRLFDAILAADGEKTVAQLLPGFDRDQPATGLHALRNLRDQKLIRPTEGGNWQPGKHPLVTRYGRLVDRLRRYQPTPGTASRSLP